MCVCVAVEFLDSESMELVVRHLGYARPLPPNKFYTLIETGGSNDEHDKQVSPIMCPSGSCNVSEYVL